MTQDPQTRRRFMRRTGAAMTAVGTASLASTTASAQTDDEDRGPIEQALMALAGIQGEIDSRYQRTFGDRGDATTAADETQSEFNAHAGEWVTYINDHASLSGDVQVVALEFVPDPESGETATRYLVTDHDGEGYTRAEIVAETDRETDETVRLESIAATEAADELAHAYDEFVSEGEPPSDRHLAYLAGKYRYGSKHATTTILGDELEATA